LEAELNEKKGGRVIIYKKEGGVEKGDVYYTISEAARVLDTNGTQVRIWGNQKK